MSGMASNSLDAKYVPKALYYENADSLEYMRRDSPSVYRRIDQHLTLILDLHSREPLGFSLKGFKHLYLTNILPKYTAQPVSFFKLINILEDAMSVHANTFFDQEERRKAYSDALEIAAEDDVTLDRIAM
ncbi:MAG: hypothetical protein KKF33_00870 [Alphaproteobacteria bacterium]|nr:hypothetical protein [Alphaproteobacteria bacterium]